MCILFFLCVLLLPRGRRNDLQQVLAVRPKFAYEIEENNLNSNKTTAKNESEIQKGVVLRALPDYGEVIIYYLRYIHKNKVKKVEQHNFLFSFQIRKPSANQPLAIMNDTILQTKTTIVSNNNEISLHPTAPNYDVEVKYVVCKLNLF